ncbi:FAD-dependent oxidoreductase [Cohnella fermenti]|uniref:FAD-dependent oxidoreductase n=1 Tax=Cohnella fermenti TaxID=2565925 RepID=A0A4S4BRG0_9BACL|nr:FAD-dependent oxidoreductase [Cohnella fermenti]THF77558.1 FAD-dependent oxidoreductase [Cohnella fermenti]
MEELARERIMSGIMNGAAVEESLRTPLLREYDVIVCGAGPAGLSAAWSTAGQGLRTLLIEAGGCLGGVWTSGQLALVLDVEGKGGLLREIKTRLGNEGATLPRGNEHNFVYDIETMKRLLEDLCREAGIDVLLHSRVTSAVAEGGRLRAITAECAQGRIAFGAKLFVDGTGNGDLAALAGCGYDMGHPDSGLIQPASMQAVVTGVPERFRVMETYESKREFGDYLRSIGFEPSNRAPTIIRLPLGGLYLLAVNHEFDVRCDDIVKITEATMRGRAEIHRALAALRGQAGWEELRLVATNAHISLREGRRIRGMYAISLEDIVAGRSFEDGVCAVKFAVDIHATDASQTHGYGNQGIRTKPYQIPYRSLLVPEYENLALAGRCISGDFFAHASYRVTANAVGMGEAVGFAAGLAMSRASGSERGAGANSEWDAAPSAGGAGLTPEPSFHAVDGTIVGKEMQIRGYLM